MFRTCSDIYRTNHHLVMVRVSFILIINLKVEHPEIGEENIRYVEIILLEDVWIRIYAQLGCRAWIQLFQQLLGLILEQLHLITACSASRTAMFHRCNLFVKNYPHLSEGAYSKFTIHRVDIPK